MQQLDLFAAFEPAPPVKEKPPVKKKNVVEEAPVPVIVKAEPVEQAEAPDQPIAPAPAPADESLVFSDDKIGVKIKPKPKSIFVQQPQAQVKTEVILPANQEPVITKEEVTAPVVVETTAELPKLKSVPATALAQAKAKEEGGKPKSKRGRKSYKEIDAELDLVEVPDDEVLNQKMYYSITEVARWFRVNASLLRYWENEFDILKPRKNRKGDRLFRPEDVKNLQVIYYLLRNRKFSLEGAKKYLRNHRQQADVNVQLAQSLTKFRSFLLELKANLGA